MASAQWNVIGWNPYLQRDTSGDSTFVLSAPSRIAIQNGVANWTPSTSGGGASYLVYTALLTQTGTDAPVATVLQNTLGGTVVWSYSSIGIYTGTLAGVFTNNKTIGMLPIRLDSGTQELSASLVRATDNTITYSHADGDDLGYSVFISVLVYP